MTDRFLIVGLGNIGKQYENTRHNMGFWVADELARRHNLIFGKAERKAVCADGMIVGKRVIIAKPQTYMNLSGEAVRSLADFYKIPNNQIIVVHDDIDLTLGTIRIRATGSAGGQNGVKSIIQHLGTQEFARVRCGIGRPPGKLDPSVYVLQPFSGDDAITAVILRDHASNAVETWLRDGLEKAMAQHNGVVGG